MTGIDPLTIDQTDMTEESNFAFGKAFYDAYVEKFPLSTPSIPLDNDEPVNVTGTTLYDLTVIHPKTTYYYARPTWLALSNRRQPVSIKTKNREIFFLFRLITNLNLLEPNPVRWFLQIKHIFPMGMVSIHFT